MIGIGLIGIQEKTGRKMLTRLIHQFLYYGSIETKRMIPILITIMGIVDFDIQKTDLLYKLAHDDDEELALRSLLGLGLISAGSNNSRIASLLRNLAIYYENDKNFLFVIRLSLGLLYLGKGLIGVNPFYSEDFLVNKAGFGGLFIILIAMTDMKAFILD